VCFPKIISERNGGAAQTRLGWLQRPAYTLLRPQLNAMKLMRLTARLPIDWVEQRRLLGFL
jgi:hypothetical protein